MINSGTTPRVPDLPGIREAAVWTSETILQPTRLPARLLILGGWYVGCEFASLFALFGTHDASGPDQLLPRQDPDVAAEVADILPTRVSTCAWACTPRPCTASPATARSP